MEFTITAAAPPQSVYADKPSFESPPAATDFMPVQANDIIQPNKNIDNDKEGSNKPSDIVAIEKTLVTKAMVYDDGNTEPEVNIISALDLEIISDGIEITEEQLGFYAIPQ